MEGERFVNDFMVCVMPELELYWHPRMDFHDAAKIFNQGHEKIIRKHMKDKFIVLTVYRTCFGKMDVDKDTLKSNIGVILKCYEKFPFTEDWFMQLCCHVLLSAYYFGIERGLRTSFTFACAHISQLTMMFFINGSFRIWDKKLKIEINYQSCMNCLEKSEACPFFGTLKCNFPNISSKMAD